MRWWSWLVAASLAGTPMVVQPLEVHAQGQAYSPPSRSIRCESLNRRYNTCPVDTRGGVRLERQLSSARCIEGQTWGVNDRGIWVDQGCRGVFLVTVGPITMTCRSLNFKYQFCQVDTRGGVQLQRQLSNTRCVEGRTWGYDNRGIWVDKGCAGEFVIGAADPGGIVPPPAVERVIRCESINKQRVVCPVDTRGATVTLERQLSGAQCVQNQTWGFDNQGIWVTGGCRGDFRVSRAGGQLVVCRSRDGLYTRCPADTRKGVELQRSLGRGLCRKDQTWGFDRQGIWVTQGCEGEFLVWQ